MIQTGSHCETVLNQYHRLFDKNRQVGVGLIVKENKECHLFT